MNSESEHIIPWGSSGREVYERTYSRVKPNGEKESWFETVARVAQGNLAFVHGPDFQSWPQGAKDEYEELYDSILNFRIIPAGRHLWATGARKHNLFNCFTSAWHDKLSEHFEFTFLRLMEGGGVGANYSTRYLTGYGAPRRELVAHIVCDPDHADYALMHSAGVLSTEYDHGWDGAFVVEDSREGWADALTDLIDTFMTDGPVQHQNRVYDVSRVRPKGARLQAFGGSASGPGPFATMMHNVCKTMNEAYLCPHLLPVEAMSIDHAIAECVVSGGNRRSARMAMVDWDDPFISDFLACKDDPSKHWTTNISVAIDSRFIECLDLPHGEGLLAKDVFGFIVQGMLKNGEPGIWNRSLSQEGELEPVYCTNPCGEIALDEWEACNLGHVNLSAFKSPSLPSAPRNTGLRRAHELMARFLVRATFAEIRDPLTRQVQDRNRRIGVGHFGLQGFLANHGLTYTEGASSHELAIALEDLSDVTEDAARQAAFEYRVPEPVKTRTVAPTGTIAKLPGATEGIHPIYAHYFERRIRFSRADPAQVARLAELEREGIVVEDDVYDPSGNTAVAVFPTKEMLVEQHGDDMIESVEQIDLADMLQMQALYQECWADNAVSFTVNVQPGRYTFSEATDTIKEYLPSLKGLTLMVDESRPQAPYTRITREQYEASGSNSVEDSTDEECASGACPIR